MSAAGSPPAIPRSRAFACWSNGWTEFCYRFVVLCINHYKYIDFFSAKSHYCPAPASQSPLRAPDELLNLRSHSCPYRPQGSSTRLRLERSCPEGRGSEPNEQTA